MAGIFWPFVCGRQLTPRPTIRSAILAMLRSMIGRSTIRAGVSTSYLLRPTTPGVVICRSIVCIVPLLPSLPLPANRVGHPPRVGPGHPRAPLAVDQDRAQRAGRRGEVWPLLDPVPARLQLGQRLGRDAALDPQQAGIVVMRVRGAREAVGRQARPLDGVLRIELEIDDVDYELGHRLR